MAGAGKDGEAILRRTGFVCSLQASSASSRQQARCMATSKNRPRTRRWSTHSSRRSTRTRAHETEEREERRARAGCAV